MQAQKLGGRWFAGVVIVGCIALGLAACGRKSSLDPPNAAAPPPAQTSQAGEAGSGQSPDWRAPPQEDAAAPGSRDRGFILDPLLR